MNKKEHLKKKKQRNDNLNLLINNLKTNDENFNKFIDIINSNKFFNQLNNNEIKEILKDTSFINLTNNNIKISIHKKEDEILIGMDPAKYFNKLNDCSVLIHFPMKKRSFQLFENFLLKIFDEKNDLHKQWMETSRYSWGGEFAKF